MVGEEKTSAQRFDVIILFPDIRRSPVDMVNIPLFYHGFRTSKRWILIAGFLNHKQYYQPKQAALLWWQIHARISIFWSPHKNWSYLIPVVFRFKKKCGLRKTPRRIHGTGKFIPTLILRKVTLLFRATKACAADPWRHATQLMAIIVVTEFLQFTKIIEPSCSLKRSMLILLWNLKYMVWHTHSPYGFKPYFRDFLRFQQGSRPLKTKLWLQRSANIERVHHGACSVPSTIVAIPKGACSGLKEMPFHIVSITDWQTQRMNHLLRFELVNLPTWLHQHCWPRSHSPWCSMVQDLSDMRLVHTSSPMALDQLHQLLTMVLKCHLAHALNADQLTLVHVDDHLPSPPMDSWARRWYSLSKGNPWSKHPSKSRCHVDTVDWHMRDQP